jgi:hypothetical protein
MTLLLAHLYANAPGLILFGARKTQREYAIDEIRFNLVRVDHKRQ